MDTSVLRRSCTSESYLVDLNVCLIDFSFGSPLFRSLAFKLSLEVVDPTLKSSLLLVELVDLLLQTLFITRGDVQLLDSLLDVLHLATLLLLEHALFFLKLLLAGTSVSIKLLLVHLINSKFGELEFALLILFDQLHLLLFALQVSLKLLGKDTFILTELNLPFVLKAVFFSPDKRLLLLGMFSESTCGVTFKLLFVGREFLSDDGALVFAAGFNFLLEGLQFLLIFAFFLSLQVEHLLVQLVLKFTFLIFEPPIDVSSQSFNLASIFGLELPLFSTQAVNIGSLSFELPVLLLSELFNFKIKSFFLTLFDGPFDPIVVRDELALFILKLLFEVTLILADPSVSFHLYLPDFLLFFNSEVLSKGMEFAVGL